MATVNKDFKIKNGLIVEGANATVNGYDVLTKDTDDQNYIIGLIGGSATSAATPDTVVLRDENADFAANEITVQSLVLNGSDLQGLLNSADTAAQGYATTAESNANSYTNGEITTALTTAQGYANTAESDANAYTDNQLANYTTTANLDTTIDGYGYLKSGDLSGYATETYADNAASNAQSAAETTASNALSTHESDTSTHGVTGAIVGTTDTQTISNKTLGSDLAAGGYKVSGLATPTSNADAATKSYVDTAVANLVDSAPALLDTLNELAAAIGDDANFVSTVTTSIGEKVAKAGDSMTGDLDFGGTNKVTSLATPTSNGDAANKLYVDSEISDLDTAAQGYASTAQSNAETFATNAANTAESNAEAYADSLAVNYDPAGSAATAQSNANSYTDTAISGVNTTINNLTTDDIAEGSNEYFTDAKAKTSAADLLTGASLTNITITGTGAGLTITAENGVADSTTADLAEDPSGNGSSGTWYFTDARAVSALEAVVPNFTAVELNSVAKQVAATTSVPTASQITAFSFAKADYRSAKFLIKTAYGSHTELTEVLLTLDTSDNIAITEYATVGTNGSSMTVTADIDGSNARLRVTTANNNSTVTVMGTLVA